MHFLILSSESEPDFVEKMQHSVSQKLFVSVVTIP